MNYLEVIAFRKKYPYCCLVSLFPPNSGANVTFNVVQCNRYDLHSKKYDYLIPEADAVLLSDLKTMNAPPSRQKGFESFDEETHYKYLEQIIKKIESKPHVKIS